MPEKAGKRIPLHLAGLDVSPEAVGSMTVLAKLENLNNVLDRIHELLDRCRCPLSVRMQIDIALEELFVNVCNYAYAGLPKKGDVRIDYECDEPSKKLIVRLIDQGVPFDPLAVADPKRADSIEETKVGGLGIFMVKKFVDHLSYKRDGESNVVEFTKAWK